MVPAESGQNLNVIEVCAGAGGQTLGLERAGFRHELAVELDQHAAETLRHNLEVRLGYSKEEAQRTVRVGDAASPHVWDPEDYVGRVDLLAGGVPCPPFSVAGKQLGANDERDLFAWAVELCGKIQPKALLLENVRGLSASRFTAYRQHVLDRLHEYGYIGFWRLLQANEYGVSQLRPRFVLVALKEEYAPYFSWPAPSPEAPPTVGELLRDLIAAGGWEQDKVERWVKTASDIAPTIVGGSKKHGGADLGPSRAKRAWNELGVDAWGIADAPPSPGWEPPGEDSGKRQVSGPKLTADMVARIQGFQDPDGPQRDAVKDFRWEFKGRKTSKYRQIGNAFPPPVAFHVGDAIKKALLQQGDKQPLVENTEIVLDPVYKLLHRSRRHLSLDRIIEKLAADGINLEPGEVERRLNHLARDFTLTTEIKAGKQVHLLGEFKAFRGQEDHERHTLFEEHRARIS